MWQSACFFMAFTRRTYITMTFAMLNLLCIIRLPAENYCERALGGLLQACSTVELHRTSFCPILGGTPPGAYLCYLREAPLFGHRTPRFFALNGSRWWITQSIHSSSSFLEAHCHYRYFLNRASYVYINISQESQTNLYGNQIVVAMVLFCALNQSSENKTIDYYSSSTLMGTYL